MSEKALLHACKRGDNHDVRDLINKGVSENTIDPESDISALMYAAWNNNLLSASVLLSAKNIDVNYKEPNHGISALLLAAADGCHNIVCLLSNHSDIDINIKMNNGTTPLMRAARFGCHKSIEELLKHKKIAVNEKNDCGETALQQLVKMENAHKHMPYDWMKPDYIASIRHLLNYTNIDPNLTNDSNETPLYIAYHNNKHSMVKELLTHPRIIIDEMSYKLAVERKDDAIIGRYSK
jgi:ankyrin repeat protein